MTTMGACVGFNRGDHVHDREVISMAMNTLINAHALPTVYVFYPFLINE